MIGKALLPHSPLQFVITVCSALLFAYLFERNHFGTFWFGLVIAGAVVTVMNVLVALFASTVQQLMQRPLAAQAVVAIILTVAMAAIWLMHP